MNIIPKRNTGTAMNIIHNRKTSCWIFENQYTVVLIQARS